MKYKGLFISFEGAEGVGKSTQLRLLEARLRAEGYSVYCTREPGGTALGEELRRLLKTHEMHALTELFIVEASRNEHVIHEILPRLKKGQIVLCDRFSESSLVYQGIIGKIPTRIVRQMNTLATSGLSPDFCVWLDLPSSAIKERLTTRASGPDRFDAKPELFHQKVASAYRQLAKTSKKPCLQKFDARLLPEDLHEKIFHAVKKLMKGRKI